MSAIALLAAVAVQSVVANGIESRWFEDVVPMEKGDVLRADVASGSSQFVPHANVRGEQFRVANPRIAHNRVFADEYELILPVQ